jgi:disulfide oxidoreductase YuzD
MIYEKEIEATGGRKVVYKINVNQQIKGELKIANTNNYANSCKFCSNTCKSNMQNLKIIVKCSCCNKIINKYPNEIMKSKSGFIFCSQSCAATYNNKHKTIGNRRSKLETWLESKLIEAYPNIEFHFNRKDVINSELDIYIPSLKLAFELNGIFHYEPIYGQDKLDQIQNNDNRKFQACVENGIELCLIDTSTQKYFKETTSIKFFEIIGVSISDITFDYSQQKVNQKEFTVTFKFNFIDIEFNLNKSKVLGIMNDGNVKIINK